MHPVRFLTTRLSIVIATSITFMLIGSTALTTEVTAADDRGDYSVTIEITTPLILQSVPMDPEIDFGDLIARLGRQGVLDTTSIQVIDLAAGGPIPHALGDDFSYGDRGRVEWVVPDPAHTEYEIRFSIAASRPHPVAQVHVPLIGTGDLLRFNAGEPRPVTLMNAMGLHDVTGDGRADLVGTWNYARRPGDRGAEWLPIPRPATSCSSATCADSGTVRRTTGSIGNSLPASISLPTSPISTRTVCSIW